MALAAAVSGLARKVRPPLPCRPSKLRLLVETLYWPGESWSPFMAMHMEQPGSRHSQPAARKISGSPSAMAWRLTSCDPGTTSTRTLSLTLRPLSRPAAMRRSLMRELVQLPMKTTSKQGLDRQLFNDWRYDAAGNPNPDFVLNRPESQGVQVLLAGDNFGCGSSREHAPWALTQWGFRAVISTSFADIFQQNSLKNSLLPIIVPPDVHAELFAAGPGAIVKIDLPNQTLTTPAGRVVKFPVDAFSKHCLVKGVDELGYILEQSSEIAAYEAANPAPINALA